VKRSSKPPERTQRFDRYEAVRRRELGGREPGRIALVVGRRVGQRHDDAACQGIGTGCERLEARAEPIAVRYRVVVRECDDGRCGGAPAEIARRRRAAPLREREQAHGPGVTAYGLTRACMRSVADDDDLVLRARQRLRIERLEAAAEQSLTPASRNDDRYARAHCGFSIRNEPIASASSGVLQKLSSASRGVQTTGSPRLLNDVFTSTGTPVRRPNASSSAR
jgi:hypothetical protein